MEQPWDKKKNRETATEQRKNQPKSIKEQIGGFSDRELQEKILVSQLKANKTLMSINTHLTIYTALIIIGLVGGLILNLM